MDSTLASAVDDLLEDTTLVPYVSHLSMKEKLAAHIHIHLLFSPAQEETWTLLERQFPRSTEKEFNAAVALLEMEDVISIDPHPHYPAEMLIKIDNSSADDPVLASVPLPFPGFRYPQLDTPLGTGTRHSSATSASATDPHTPSKAVHFLPSMLKPSSSSVKASRSSHKVENDSDESWGKAWADGAWSHTPPRLKDALGEEDDLTDGAQETLLAPSEGELAAGEDALRDPKGREREGSVGQEALLRLVDHPHT